MDIYKKYLPLDSKEKINAMMEELRQHPEELYEKMFSKINNNISEKKTKLRIYFQDLRKEFCNEGPKFEYLESGERETLPDFVEVPIIEYKPKVVVDGVNTTFYEELLDKQEIKKAELQNKEFNLPSDIDNDDKKFQFGAYFEMAFHNYAVTMIHIYRKLSGVDIIEETKRQEPDWDGDFANEEKVWTPILKYLSTELADKEKERQKMELLDKHFPMLNCVYEYKCTKLNDRSKKLKTKKAKSTTQEQKERIKEELDALVDPIRLDEYIETLTMFSQSIRFLRNKCAHFNIKDSKKQKSQYFFNEYNLLIVLQACYDSATNVVMERNNYTKGNVSFTKQYDYEKTDTGYMPLLKPECRYQFYSYSNDAKHFSSFGYLFMLGLFLDRKYYMKMFITLGWISQQNISNTKKTKEQIELERQIGILADMIGVYRTRQHYQKLSSSKENTALALDILNELQKCPAELYDIISEKDRELFHRVITEGDDAGEKFVLRRSTDRFPRLVMNYIDTLGEGKGFKRLRFMTSLGTYFFKFYDKKCIDGINRVRCLSKQITGFGKLSEIEEERKKKYKDVIRDYELFHLNTTKEKPYLTDTYANYLFNGSGHSKRIGMYLTTDGKPILPELSSDTKEPKSPDSIPPTCWMSTHELPALALLLHLTDCDSTAEDIIINMIEAYRNMFADISEGTLTPQPSAEALQGVLDEHYNGIKVRYIPQAMQDYLLGKSCQIEEEMHDWIDKRLEAMKEDTKRRQELSRKNIEMMKKKGRRDCGKKMFVEKKDGRLADFIARDIMYFQPNDKDNKNKLTTLNFNVLQAEFATYKKENYDALKRVLTSAGIIGNRPKELLNPFASSVFGNRPYENLSTLYDAYLNKRLAYLEGCKGKEAVKKCTFLHLGRKKWDEHTPDFYRSMAARYLKDSYNNREFDKSIELPRGIFDNAIRTRLARLDHFDLPDINEIVEMRDETRADSNPGKGYKYNMIYLINRYYQTQYNDGAQEWYSLKRHYPIFKIIQTGTDLYYDNAEIAEQIKKDGMLKKSLLNLKKDDVNTTSEEKKKYNSRLFCYLKENETLLKRYRTQDIILFLIAKHILSEKDDAIINESLKGLSLCNISNRPIRELDPNNIQEEDADRTDKMVRLLSLTIPKFRIAVKTKSGRVVNVVQNNMVIKNYSQFYRFINDRRIPSLLDMTDDDEIMREDLEHELIHYDNVHPKIIKLVYDFEKTHPEKTKFRDCLIASGVSEGERKPLINIRNAFSHISYPTEITDAYDKTVTSVDEAGRKTEEIEKAKRAIPKKADFIFEYFKKKMEEIGVNRQSDNQ